MTANSQIKLELLDSARGKTVQTWRFTERFFVRIGRGEACHVCIGDDTVSRVHVDLSYRDGAWDLVPLGRNGVVIAGSRVERTTLTGDTVFRLGASGPMLRFSLIEEPSLNGATICVESPLVPLVGVDEQRKEEEVRQIAESDYFQSLRNRARNLKQGGPPSTTDTTVPPPSSSAS
jgi:hypothetical protein